MMFDWCCEGCQPITPKLKTIQPMKITKKQIGLLLIGSSLIGLLCTIAINKVNK
jgi:hypothetical protein